VAFAALFALTFLLPHREQGGFAATLGVVGTVAALAAYLSVLLLRCPRCRANLGTTIVIPTAFRMFGRDVKYCPHYAVSLDEPMDKPAVG